MQAKNTPKLIILLIFICLTYSAQASRLFIPMDADGQTNHLKAYGVAFAALKQGIKVDWLLNYKGGSFGMDYKKEIEDLCHARGVTCLKLKEKDYADIKHEVSGLKYDGEVVVLEKAPRIAVYTPLNKEPWDDAVTLALTYAEIPFDKIYADEVLHGALDNYDWLHLHHEDFTGQYGKFWAAYHNASWYQDDVRAEEQLATKNGYRKVSQMQVAVVKKIREFIVSGGNMFAMCTATDTYDIAQAADSIDICESQFDGDPADADIQTRLNYKKCLAFTKFLVFTDPYYNEFSTIDNTLFRKVTKEQDFFTLASFPAKYDIVPAMLCQNHTSVIKGFMGQTTAFRKDVLKPGVLVMGDFKEAGEARYIHGELGKGAWTFYGGHDPEDYQHMVGNPPTNLNYYRSSPGYRLILNNVLCPAAKKKDIPTVIIKDTTNRQKQPVAELTPSPVPVSPRKEQATIKAPEKTENSAPKVKIEANAANNEMIISYLSGDRKIEKVVMMDVSGKKVLEKTFNDYVVHVSLADLSPGIYLLEINGVYAGKVVRE